MCKTPEDLNLNGIDTVAVDIETFTIVKALGKHGFRGPGAMIAKLVDSELKKVAKKQGVSPDAFRAKLLAEGKTLTKAKKQYLHLTL